MGSLTTVSLFLLYWQIMVERLIDNYWVECKIWDIRTGDVYRTRDEDGKRVSPLFLAEADPVHLPASDGRPARWHVKTRFYTMDTPSTGRPH